MQAIDIYHSALIALNIFQNISDKKIELQSPEPHFVIKKEWRRHLFYWRIFFFKKSIFSFHPFTNITGFLDILLLFMTF